MDELINYIDAVIGRAQVKQPFYNFVDTEILKHKGYILKSVKLRIYQKGLDGDLNPLIAKDTTHEAQEKYKNEKRKRGFRSRPTNLRVTGEFMDSLVVTCKKGEVRIVVPDSVKNKTLLNKYGDISIQITSQDAEYIIEKIQDPIARWLFGDKDLIVEIV